MIQFIKAIKRENIQGVFIGTFIGTVDLDIGVLTELTLTSRDVCHFNTETSLHEC